MFRGYGDDQAPVLEDSPNVVQPFRFHSDAALAQVATEYDCLCVLILSFSSSPGRHFNRNSNLECDAHNRNSVPNRRFAFRLIVFSTGGRFVFGSTAALEAIAHKAPVGV
jgi:hypothetical protein